MRFYNSRNSNFVMKFRRNCYIDLYFGNIFLQFWINIDFYQGAVVSLSAPKFILIDHRPPRTHYCPPVGGSAHVGNRCTKRMVFYRQTRRNIFAAGLRARRLHIQRVIPEVRPLITRTHRTMESHVLVRFARSQFFRQ